MKYKHLIDAMKKYGSSEEDICRATIGVERKFIQENVVIAPCWEPNILPDLGEVEFLSESEFASIKVWTIRNQSNQMTYIKTGISAPVLMDVVLALGLTACKKIFFVGSVGAINESINIGDIVIPEYSICGDGASRYISNNKLTISDVFGEKVFPDDNGLLQLSKIVSQICSTENI